MSILDKRIFYSYWDVNGHGINREHLSTYSASIIFDSYNRTLYSYGAAFGNHQLGSYHGEIFNDFVNNNAAGNYSSAHGSNVEARNAYEFGVGHYNMSGEIAGKKTIFTVGNGTPSLRRNAFWIDEDDDAHVAGDIYARDIHAGYAYYDTGRFDTVYIGKAYVTYEAVKNSYVDVLTVNNTEYVDKSYVSYSVIEKQYVDEQYIDLTYTDTAYIKNAYADSAYAKELDVDGTANINTAYVEENAYITSYAYISYVESKTNKTDFSYVEENEYVKGELWVDDQEVGHNMKNMVKMFPMPDDRHTYDGFYSGVHYIWVGTAVQLPAPEDRYANVIYIVTDEAPSADLPAFHDEGWEDIIMLDSPNGANDMLFSDDANPEVSDDRVIRYD